MCVALPAPQAQARLSSVGTTPGPGTYWSQDVVSSSLSKYRSGGSFGFGSGERASLAKVKF